MYFLDWSLSGTFLTRRAVFIDSPLRELLSHPTMQLLLGARFVEDTHGTLAHEFFVFIVVIHHLWNVARCAWGVPSEIHLICELRIWS